jgi:hypothetical protein
MRVVRRIAGLVAALAIAVPVGSGCGGEANESASINAQQAFHIFVQGQTHVSATEWRRAVQVLARTCHGQGIEFGDGRARCVTGLHVAPVVSVSSVEHALLAHGGPPRPTTASCRPSTSAERVSAPFGPTHLPLLTCALTWMGERASFVVQVLPDGCFVAERRRRGRAVYGCGVRRQGTYFGGSYGT